MKTRCTRACASTVLGLLVLALFSGALIAQENTGTILGTVTDATGAVVPDAKITISGPSLPRGMETTSNSAGNYQFLRVPIGTYAITVTKQGFTTLRQQGVQVSLGSQVTYNPKLEVGQVSQVVEVQDSAISIDPTSSRTSTNISAQQFWNLPKGRTFNSILEMAPGTRIEVKGGQSGVGGIQVDGASGSENAFFIDGVEVSDVRRGSLRAQSAVPFEFVQEVQIKSGGFEAEYGGATGGVVNVATRGGSNEFHGEGYFQLTNDGLNATERGAWQRSAANAAVAEFVRWKQDDYSILYPGFRLGGPMIKNTLFWSAAYSPELEKTTRVVNYASGARTFKQDEKRHYALGRIDAQPWQRLQINSSWAWSPVKQLGSLPNRDPRVAPPSNDLSIQGGYRPSQQYTLSGTLSPTNNIVIQARYGYRYMNDKMGNYGLSTQPYLIYRDAATKFPELPAEIRQPNGWVNVSSTLGIVKDITTRNNVYLDMTYIVGSHTFKGGWQLNRLHNDTLNDYTNGRFDIYWGQTFNRAGVTGTGRYGYYIWEDGVKNKGNVSSRNQGFYIQDTWRARPNLTLNLGIRLENEFLPPFKAEHNGKPVPNPVSFGWGDKIAPRLGAAWDILGDGRWKLSGSFGLFYDMLKYELARGSFGSDYWWSHVYALDNPNLFALGFANPGAGGPKITQYDNRSLHVNANNEIEGIDPSIDPFTSREFTVNLEHQLASRLVFGARYTRKDLLKAIEDIGVLDAEGSEVYVIGNPGFGLTRNDPAKVLDRKTPDGQEYLVPKAVRQYDAVEFRLQGQARSATFLGSYTWSRLYGNYAGAANSDESGRSDPGVSRAFDLPYYYFDASGSQRNVLGVLGTDRPHTFKFFGSYELKSKVGSSTFGLTQLAYSGTPDSSTIIYLSAPTFPYGRNDLGRTPFLTQTNLALRHRISATERAKIDLEWNIVNLFNQAAVIQRTTQMNRSGAFSIPESQFFAGYDPKRYLSTNGGNGTIPINPIYGLPSANYRNGGYYSNTVSSAFYATFPGFGGYQEGRVMRMGIRFLF